MEETVVNKTLATIREEARAEAHAELEAFIAANFPPDIQEQIRHNVAFGEIPPIREMSKAAFPVPERRGARILVLPDVKLKSDKEKKAEKWMASLVKEVQGQSAPANEQITMGL